MPSGFHQAEEEKEKRHPSWSDIQCSLFLSLNGTLTHSGRCRSIDAAVICFIVIIYFYLCYLNCSCPGHKYKTHFRKGGRERKLAGHFWAGNRLEVTAEVCRVRPATGSSRMDPEAGAELWGYNPAPVLALCWGAGGNLALMETQRPSRRLLAVTPFFWRLLLCRSTRSCSSSPGTRLCGLPCPSQGEGWLEGAGRHRGPAMDT